MLYHGVMLRKYLQGLMHEQNEQGCPKPDDHEIWFSPAKTSRVCATILACVDVQFRHLIDGELGSFLIGPNR